MSGCDCDPDLEPGDRAQRRVLWLLLAINGVMFVAELGAGLLAQSSALVADSLDMLADASVYGLGLYAVGRAAQLKARTALFSGGLEVALGVLVLVEVALKLGLGSQPESLWMMAVGLVALAANVTCLHLLAAHREGDVHMRASWIFSKNDVIANLGVIGAGALVWWFGSALPDLIIGAAIAFIVVRGGVQILAAARSAALGDGVGPL